MTVRNAFAIVENQTGQSITGVSLIHKYSDDYVDKEAWGDFIPDGGTSQRLAVSYHTGAFTTGKDWWYISWFNQDFSYHRCSNPNNFRDIIDGLEAAAPVIAAAAAAYVSAGAATPALVAASASAAAAATNTLATKGATAGFKQHILRGDDAGKTVRIILKKEGKITIQSPSGTSDTVYRGKDISND